MKNLIFGFAFIAAMLVGFTSLDGGVNSVFATSTDPIATSTDDVVDEDDSEPVSSGSSYCYVCSNGVVVEANYNIRQVETHESSAYGLVVANYLTTQYMTSSIEITDEYGDVFVVTNEDDGARHNMNGIVSYHTVQAYLPYGTYSIRPMSTWKGIYTSYGRSTTLTIE